jgi:protein SCO1/2
MTNARTIWAKIASALLFVALTLSPPAAMSQQTHWRADYFPNVALTDQNGRRLRFYDDIIRGKIVSINFIYTSCTDICPLDTAQLRRVQQMLGDRVGRDIHMYSISVDPANDTPATLRRFMRSYDVGPGWTFLTGSREDVDLLQRRLGISPIEPGARLSEHDTSIVVGNETTGQWIRRSAYENPTLLANLLTSRLQNHAPNAGERQSYAVAGQVTDTSPGAYLYRTRCRSCHTIGEGDRLGPDLAGVTASRPAAWLERWIREPDVMLAEGDPTATAMLPRYRNLPMPNLGLSHQDVDAVMTYLRAQDAARARPTGHQ